MTTKARGLKLRTKDGHAEWAEPQFRELPGPSGPSFGMAVPCDLGGVALVHWLAPDPTAPGRLTWQNEPHGWPTPHEAFEARDRYEKQLERGFE